MSLKFPEIQGKLEEDVKLAKSIEGDIEVTSMIKVGNIFDDIGDAADEVKASMIVMGTHGASGWQKITGSNALRVITNSKVPFVVVQKQVMKESGYDCIVAPLDLHNETETKATGCGRYGFLFQVRSACSYS